MFKFEKGNVPLSVFKTENPIEQKNIDPEIWEMIQKESGASEELKDGNKIEFIIMRDDTTKEYSARFIKITKQDGVILEFKASKELCDVIANLHIGDSSQN